MGNCADAQLGSSSASAQQLALLNTKQQNLLFLPEAQSVTGDQARKIEADLAACYEDMEKVQAAAVLVSL